jgi:predicted HicB family RNase H-like nuclease
VNHYTYRGEWSSEHGEYVGHCLESPWLSQWAPTMQTAIAGVERAVDEHLAERGEDVPPPLTERKFSGKFLVRTSPALHARLTVEAAEQNVSLNQWLVQKLADRSVRPLISPAVSFRKQVYTSRNPRTFRNRSRGPRVRESRPSARGRPPPR